MFKNRKYKLAFLFAALSALGVLLGLFLRSNNVAVLSPEGPIASQQKSLIITATLLMLIVVIPVFILTAVIAWKYREANTKAKYTPDWDGHRGLEIGWWAIPGIIILILSVITWNSSHALDPFKAIDSNVKPLTVQVVALQWKWLFIYPEQNIATVNMLQIPQSTPINFEITADAPMNSFWIPQLGGQVYAMSGMKTQLHLMADKAGTYYGSSANISGEGFAGMKFTAKSSSPADFEQWVRLVRQSRFQLNLDEYNRLARPSKDNPPVYYSSAVPGLHDSVVMKFITPPSPLLTPEKGPMPLYVPATEHSHMHSPEAY